MIDRKLTANEIRRELERRVARHIIDALYGNGDLDRAFERAAAELELEIRAYWAGLELAWRKAQGEKPN